MKSNTKLKNVKVDYETWRDLTKQKIENNLRKIGEVIKNNNAIAKKFNDEEQFAEWFMENHQSLGFDKIVEHRKNKFPDFIMTMDNEEVKVELETLSSHFIQHSHDPKHTDFVICLIKDKELPVTTIEVSMFEYLLPPKKGIMTFGGETELWIDFVHKVKKDKKRVWEVLKPFLKKYILSDENCRVLIGLFPSELAEQLFHKDDPDAFLEQAVRKMLESPEPLSPG